RVSTPPELPGWRHTYSGKVRDLYVPDTVPDTAPDAAPDAGRDSSDRLLVVASDRVSAFDVVLSPGIPDKGVLLTTLRRRPAEAAPLTPAEEAALEKRLAERPDLDASSPHDHP
ncbi:MAG: phosphoribosylaminoimidazolesuccinocarboxamide synthase, partial [Brevundimonas sp.]